LDLEVPGAEALLMLALHRSDSVRFKAASIPLSSRLGACRRFSLDDSGVSTPVEMGQQIGPPPPARRSLDTTFNR